MAASEFFADRREAGRRLAAAVTAVAPQDPVVFALPRGGVPVAAEVAAALGAPLDLVLVRKLGAPYQPELAVGAIVDGETPEVVINREIAASTGADARYLAQAQAQAVKEIERRRAAYLRGRAPIDPAGHDAIVVDDGIATGATALAAVHALRRRGARRVIVATPIAPPDAVEHLRAEADDVVCLSQPDGFSGISAFYGDFHQLGDAEVIALLDAAAMRRAPPGTAF
jgi:putative phosphoribosyl transferase